MRRTVIVAGALLLACYCAAALYMTLAQRSFLYHVAPAWLEPHDYGLPQADAISQTMKDGVTLRGWSIKPSRDDAPVYLYFHGNADGLNERATRFGYLASTGAGVIAFSYRGYGGSGGAP
jgi:dipeptidyl aminopeptidase/acylaminoacyl peptidase